MIKFRSSCRTRNVISKGVDLLYSLLSNTDTRNTSAAFIVIYSFQRISWNYYWHNLLEDGLKNLPCEYNGKSQCGSRDISPREADNTFTSDGLSRHIVTKRHLFWTCVVSHESLDHCRSLTDVTETPIGPSLSMEMLTTNRKWGFLYQKLGMNVTRVFRIPWRKAVATTQNFDPSLQDFCDNRWTSSHGRRSQDCTPKRIANQWVTSKTTIYMI